MPDVGLVDMAHLDSIRLLDESDPRSMDIQKDLTPSPAPALKEPISRVGKGNGGIMTSKNYRGFIVEIRPPKWDMKLWISAVDHQAAQYVADAVLHYVGRPPFHFPGADFRYPPLSLNTGEYLTTRGECSAYVAKIAKGSALRCIRVEYKVLVIKVVLDAVKSPEVVQFLSSVRKSPWQLPHVDASKSGNLVLEAANSKLDTPVVDVEEEHWKPRGFDVKEAVVLPRVKQYFRDDDDVATKLQCLVAHVQWKPLEEASFASSYNWKSQWTLDYKDVQIIHTPLPSEAKKRVHSIKSFADFKPSKYMCVFPCVKKYFFDDHDRDVSLLPSSSTEEDDKGGVVLSIFSIPSSASPSTIVNSLVEAARSWRSQKKKALLLKLLPTQYDQFLYPSLKAGFTIHQVEATGMMLVQGLLAHAQPEQVEEASFDSSYNLKKRRWTLDYKDVQIADSCFPSARRCPSEKSDVYSFAMTCSEILTSEAKKGVHSIKSFADFKPSKVDSCIAPSGCPNALIFGQDVTNDQDLPHSIPGPGAVGTPEIKQHVEHPVGADPPSHIYYLEGVDDDQDSESEAMDLRNDEEVLSGESGASLESHTEIASADSHGPRTEPSRKRSAASAFYDDDLFAEIRSFVNQRIEEALLPLMSALRSREEDEHKHRQKMLALEQEKLALMRQKLVRTTRSNAVPASVAK